MTNDRTPTSLPISEAARQLSLSTEAIRARIRRGSLEGFRDNRGRWWVHLDGDRTNLLPGDGRGVLMSREDDRTPVTTRSDEGRTALIDVLRRQIDQLQADRERDRGDHDRQIDQLRTDLDRERAEHRAVVDRLLAERDRERSERDRQQSERLQAELDQIRAAWDGARALRDQTLHATQTERQQLLTQHQAEGDRLRADHAAELARLQQVIHRLTAPWWRRWFGG